MTSLLPFTFTTLYWMGRNVVWWRLMPLLHSFLKLHLSALQVLRLTCFQQHLWVLGPGLTWQWSKVSKSGSPTHSTFMRETGWERPWRHFYLLPLHHRESETPRLSSFRQNENVNAEVFRTERLYFKGCVAQVNENGIFLEFRWALNTVLRVLYKECKSSCVSVYGHCTHQIKPLHCIDANARKKTTAFNFNWTLAIKVIFQRIAMHCTATKQSEPARIDCNMLCLLVVGKLHCHNITGRALSCHVSRHCNALLIGSVSLQCNDLVLTVSTLLRGSALLERVSTQRTAEKGFE